jgi:hypothetical protein
MLSNAKVICQGLLGPGGDYGRAQSIDLTQGYHQDIDTNKTLIVSNGDAEMWFDLCSFSHPTPVRAFHAYPPGSTLGCAQSTQATLCEQAIYSTSLDFTVQQQALIDPGSYPPNTPVGNAQGTVDLSLTPGNLWPWCVVPEGGLSQADAAAQHWPVCPASATYWQTPDASRWAVQGAINAGQAVFLYVEELESKTAPDPDYDECELLGHGSSP